MKSLKLQSTVFGMAVFFWMALFASLLLLVSCDADSPTAPQQRGNAVVPPPTNGGPSATWNVTVTADPSSIELEEEDAGIPFQVRITVNVRRTSDNQPPPNGASALLSTTGGGFLQGDGTLTTTTAVQLTNGRANATLVLNGIQTGNFVVQAQFEQSFGQTTITVTPPPEPEPTAPLFIASITPNAGPASGGTRVLILGSGFETPVRVLFGPSAAQVTSVSPTSLVVTTPAFPIGVGQTQVVSVTVMTNVNETEEDQGEGNVPRTDTLANAFTYFGEQVIMPDIFSLTPTSGPNEGGTQVTIFGEGFQSPVQVFFGTDTLLEANVQSVAPNRILVVTPAALGSGSVNRNRLVNVRVVNLGNGLSDTAMNAFQYGSVDTSPVLITSVGPTEGPYFGGTRVRIFGTGFEEPVAVGLAGVAADIISVTGTELIVQSAAVDIENCTDVMGPVGVTNIETGESTSALTWIYRRLEPVIFSIQPTSADEDGGGTVTITGANFFAPMRVTFGEGDSEVTAANVQVISPSEIRAEIPGFAGDFEEVACDDNGDGQEGMRFRPARVDVTVVNLATDCDTMFNNAFTYIPDDESCRGDVAEGEAPVASFEVSVTGLRVFFTNTSTGITPSTTFLWNFGDGTTSNQQNPFPGGKVYDDPGTYTIVLTVTNENGSSTATQMVTLEANDPPVASFTFSGTGQTVTVTDTSTGNPTSWSWNFGDGAACGTCNQQNPGPHVYAAPGNYTISLQVSNAGGSDTTSENITVPFP